MTVKNEGSRKPDSRSLAALLAALAFLVLFAFAGVNASTTLKETTVSTLMPLPKLFFSLSSASILLIPLSVVCMGCALVALLSRQRNVAMLFAGISFVTFGLFLFFFSREEMNSALYTPLSDALKEAASALHGLNRSISDEAYKGMKSVAEKAAEVAADVAQIADPLTGGAASRMNEAAKKAADAAGEAMDKAYGLVSEASDKAFEAASKLGEKKVAPEAEEKPANGAR